MGFPTWHWHPLPSQLPNHPNLDLGSLNTSSHRTVQHHKKGLNLALMYFEQAPLLPQSVGDRYPGGRHCHHKPGYQPPHDRARVWPGLRFLPALNVVSMQTTTAPTSSASVPGHVALTNPRLLGTPDIGSISNLLIKASQQSLGIQDQPVALPPSSGMFPPLGTSQTPPRARWQLHPASVCSPTQTAVSQLLSLWGSVKNTISFTMWTSSLASKTGVLSSQRDLDSCLQGPRDPALPRP